MPDRHPTLKPEQTDNWLEKMKSELGAENLKTIEVGQLGTADTFNKNDLSIASSTYHCATQSPLPTNIQWSNNARIQIGHNGRIARWKKGSTIGWAAYGVGYPTIDQAFYAAQKLNEAAQKWNSLSLGVTFKMVSRLEEASFVLGYGGDNGDTLAEAFFPNSNSLNPMTVYKGAFEPGHINNMDEIFLHELGHVLGLHHEFAPETPQRGATITLGSRNPFSVMSYKYPPQMQPSDETSTRLFYSITATSIGGWPIDDWTPL